LLIDSLARTYGCLPSEVLSKADTFDIMVMDVSMAWQTIQNSKRENKPLPQHMYNKDELQERLNKARNG
jgi:hypothetical protein